MGVLFSILFMTLLVLAAFGVVFVAGFATLLTLLLTSQQLTRMLTISIFWYFLFTIVFHTTFFFRKKKYFV